MWGVGNIHWTLATSFGRLQNMLCIGERFRTLIKIGVIGGMLWTLVKDVGLWGKIVALAKYAGLWQNDLRVGEGLAGYVAGWLGGAKWDGETSI